MEKSPSTSLAFLAKGKITRTHLPPGNLEGFRRGINEFKQSHRPSLLSRIANRLSASRPQENSQENPQNDRQRLELVRDFLHDQQERSHINQYEREKLRDLLIYARQLFISKAIDRQEINGIRTKAKHVVSGLDQMNRQVPLYNPETNELPPGVEAVEIETLELGKMTIRITRIKGIRTESEGTENPRHTPTVISTGWSADFKSTMALQMALALEGVDTIGIAMPEHYTSQPPLDWAVRLRGVGNYSLHAKALIEVCKKLGIPEIDLTGYSAGGAVSIATAQELSKHPEHGIRVRHLDAFDPTGFTETNVTKLAKDFIKAGIQAAFIPDLARRSMIVQRLKLSDWTHRGMGTMVTILAKKLFSSDNLATLDTVGRCNIFSSDKDPISVASDIRQEVDGTRGLDPSSRIQFREIKDANHGMLVEAAAGFAHSFAENIPIADGTNIKDIPATQADLIAKKYNLPLAA